MDEIIWALDKIFQAPLGTTVHVLQRFLPEIEVAKKEELLPFFNETTLFQLSSSNDLGAERIVGMLVDLSVGSDRSLSFAIRDTKSLSLTKWKLSPYEKTKMTVWRINNVFDTLQVNFLATDQELYMQTGGAQLSRIFQLNWTSPNPSQDINRAEMIFAENAMENRPYKT